MHYGKVQEKLQSELATLKRCVEEELQAKIVIGLQDEKNNILNTIDITYV